MTDYESNSGIGHAQRAKEKGLATVTVVVLLGLMSILLMANSRALSQLKQHLDNVETRQLKKFKPPIVEVPKVEQDSVAP